MMRFLVVLEPVVQVELVHLALANQTLVDEVGLEVELFQLFEASEQIAHGGFASRSG